MHGMDIFETSATFDKISINKSRLFHVEQLLKISLAQTPKTAVERWLLALVNSLLSHENLFDTLLHRNPSLNSKALRTILRGSSQLLRKTEWDAFSR